MEWWVGRIRQFARYVTGRVTEQERAELRRDLTAAQYALFASMHPADQRHGLDVRDALRAAGHHEPDLLLAGLLHDAAKGRTVGLWPRIVWSLSRRYGSWVLRAVRWVPGGSVAFERLRDHPEQSARLALQAGCSVRTAELIRHQEAPVDRELGVALQLADDAN